MSIRCIVIDDKPLAIDIIADYISKHPQLTLVWSGTNPIEGLTAINEHEADLVFLDIQMPELTGLQFIRIAGNKCKFILTTAYSEFALDGFEHDVIDYWLKPISFERFYRAAEKALAILSDRKPQESDMPTAPQDSPEYLFVRTEHKIQRIDTKDIRYIEGLQNYVAINTKAGRVLSLQTMKKVEEQLCGKDFIRVHRSFIVALRHISSIERSRVYIGDNIIPVGENYRDAFYKVLQHE